MLIDEATIIIKAGNGGNGAVSFRRNAQTAKGGPDGGNGGNGGSVYVCGSANISDLKDFQYKKKIAAEDGISGKKNKLFGRNGSDLTILLPLGTSIIDTATQKTLDIVEENKKICIAKGGKGGRGNTEFKSATEQTPRYAEKGEEGEEKSLHFVLKYIADIGLVGFPNSGKSTLLSLLTNARPKIGNYPFTTLQPHLGKAENVAIADIPGIIQGASTGKGLGLRFLKHIEKTNVLFYCIDSSQEDPLGIYTMLQDEFRAYDKTLLEKPEVIVFTKSDLVSDDVLKKKMQLFKKKRVIAVSKDDDASIQAVKAVVEKKAY